jgi:hypothetical protein
MINVAVTVANGICSVAKATFLIKALLAVMDPLALIMDSEKAIHGQNAMAR